MEVVRPLLIENRDETTHHKSGVSHAVLNNILYISTARYTWEHVAIWKDVLVSINLPVKNFVTSGAMFVLLTIYF